MKTNAKKFGFVIAVLGLMLFAVVTVTGCSAQNNKKTIGIIAAMDQEVVGIKDAIENPQTTTAAGSEYVKGTIGNFNVIVTKCGIGKVSAGISAQYMIDQFHPDYIINSGSAGALDPELKVGDIVVATKTAEWDMDTTSLGDKRGFISSLNDVFAYTDNTLSDAIAQNSPSDVKVVKGLVVSGDQFVDSAAQRTTILQNFADAKCAEMEGAAVGHVCAQNNVPFCVIRCMSDTADGNSGVDFNKFVVEAGKKSATNLINFLKAYNPA